MPTNLEPRPPMRLPDPRPVEALAHDCSNLMTVIGAHAEILLARLDRTDPLYENAEAIQQAVDRAGVLLRRIATVGGPQGAVETVPAPAPLPTPPRGAETILLVENETPVRALMRDILRMQGYTVLDARSGEEALDMAARYQDTIDLILTDIVMPGVAGRALIERIETARPGVKSLYVSGYGEDAMRAQGLAPETANFLAKPFSVDALARKVREVLDASG
jgi:CheY-like chemotaxis protein